MVRSIEGVYRNGKVELLEPAPTEADTPVIVTFLPQQNGGVDLASRGISAAQAADLRARFRTIADDWSRPEMDAYDAL